MFYSETLLQRQGPLVKVWLSANLERKLNKTHILQSNIQESCGAIMTPDQAPLALRLSGQLLLGVVRIYSRKARYLLDDCNEAMLKIKIAFRSGGNNDLNPESIHVANAEALMIPDRITPADNLGILPPPASGPNGDWLLDQLADIDATPTSSSQPQSRGRGRAPANRDINLHEDLNVSQFLQDDVMDEDELALANDDDLDLGLDFGDDEDERPRKGLDMSIELGRDAPDARPVEEDAISEMDMTFPTKVPEREPSTALDFGHGADGVRIVDEDGDIRMEDDLHFHIGDQSDPPALIEPIAPERARYSESPLSDIDEDAARDVEEWTRVNNASIYEPGRDITDIEVQPSKKSKGKAKAFGFDSITQLTSASIKEQQLDRSSILRNPSFVPRDRYFLALLELKRSGSFVSSVMGDGRSRAWAPELQGLLSLETIRHVKDGKKRKRDSGIADMGTDEEQGASKSPRLELGDDNELAVTGGLGEQSEVPEGTMIEIPADAAGVNKDGDEASQVHNESSPLPAFDETTVPLVHPSDSGPVSVGTKHAVHLLRDLFGSEAATSEEERQKTSVVFQELLPASRTSKADATKMFFECLVLATKDAIKVEQKEGSLGGPIRVRGKRGLWGAWAEREAGGAIAEQDEAEEGAARQPSPAIAGPSRVVAAAA